MAVAEYEDGVIKVATVWNEKDLIKQIPGASWDKDEKIWKLNPTWVACLQLRGVFGKELVIGPALRSWAADIKTNKVIPALALRDRTAPNAAFSGNQKLYPFQQAGVQFLYWAGSALLADEMGTGKTIQTLETLRLVQAKTGDALPAVVVCPNSMKGTWAREAKVWFPDASAYVVAGSALQRRKVFEAASKDPNAIVIINFESVRAHSRVLGFGSIALKDTEKQLKELNVFGFRTVVVDEAHRLKDPKAQQTRAVWAVGQGVAVKRRIALTGTPLANHPGDLWSVLHFVSPAEFPRKSAFVDRYCLVTFNGWGGLEIKGVNPDNKQEFFNVLDPRFRRMPKALVLPQLPAKVPVKRYVQMDAKQKKAYDQLAAGLITRLEDGTLMIAKSDLSARTRLLQFSSSYMCGDDASGYTMCDPSPKIDAMEEILDEMGDKQVVFCAESRQLIELAEKRLIKLGVSYSMITGKTPQWDREAQLRDFQKGTNRVMLFTIKAGGVGLTMTAADTIVFLQRSWSMIDNKQAEDRVHRIGSEVHDSIKVIDVVAEGTIEEQQIERLWEKAERLEEIVRDKAKLLAAGLSTEALDIEEQKILNADLGSAT